MTPTAATEATATHPAPVREAGARRAWRWLLHRAAHVPCLAAAGTFVWLRSPVGAVAWFAACRIAYVGFVATTLRTRARSRPPAHGAESEAEWRRFRTRASWLMDNDAAAFLGLFVTTQGTLGDTGLPYALLTATGIALTVAGLAVKAWASASLPDGAYHWRDFFVPGETTERRTGPYRFFSDPMYTVGYAHVYGIALLFRSAHGLVAAAAGQGAILLMNALAERRRPTAR